MTVFRAKAAVIKKFMKKNKISQVELAKKLGVKQPALSRSIANPYEFRQVLRVMQGIEIPITEVFPTLESDLINILTLIAQGEDQKVLNNLINLMDVKKSSKIGINDDADYTETEKSPEPTV